MEYVNKMGYMKGLKMMFNKKQKYKAHTFARCIKYCFNPIYSKDRDLAIFEVFRDKHWNPDIPIVLVFQYEQTSEDKCMSNFCKHSGYNVSIYGDAIYLVAEYIRHSDGEIDLIEIDISKKDT